MRHQRLQLTDVILVNSSRTAIIFLAEVSGHAYNLPHHAAGTDDADAPKRLVVDADISASHEKIFDVSAIKAPVWRPIGAFILTEICLRDKRVFVGRKLGICFM